jgi:teichoic acid transport system permease protein
VSVSNSRSPRAQGLHRLGTEQDLPEYLDSIWGRREFMVSVPLADLRARHMNTVLGNVWQVLNPLLLMGIYFLIFGVILKTSRGLENYLTFLAIGVFMWQYTQRSAVQGAKAIVTNEGVIRSIWFPRIILPIATVIEEAVAFLPALVVMLFIAVLTGAYPTYTWLALVAVLAVQSVLNLGLAFVTSRATHLFRDVENMLPFLFRVAFYLSGILYSVEGRIHNPFYKKLFLLNPMYCLVTLARGAIFGLSSVLLDWRLWASCSAWAVVLFVAGFAWFKAGESTYGRG